MKKILAVDMDDVLADTSGPILEIFNKVKNKKYTKEYFDNKDFYEFVSQEDRAIIYDDLGKLGFFRNLKVLPDAVEVMEKLYQKYDLFIVSAATQFPNSLIEKVEWLKEHFPFIEWKKIILCGDKRLIHADIMIDDHAYNLETFRGDTKLLFSALHNQKENRFKRVNNWKEIEAILL